MMWLAIKTRSLRLRQFVGWGGLALLDSNLIVKKRIRVSLFESKSVNRSDLDFRFDAVIRDGIVR